MLVAVGTGVRVRVGVSAGANESETTGDKMTTPVIRTAAAITYRMETICLVGGSGSGAITSLSSERLLGSSIGLGCLMPRVIALQRD